MNKTSALNILKVTILPITLLLMSIYVGKTFIIALATKNSCKELDPKYGKYYTALSGFYEGRDMLAIRPGKVTITVLILPDNMPVEVSCKDLIELDVD